MAYLFMTIGAALIIWGLRGLRRAAEDVEAMLAALEETGARVVSRVEGKTAELRAVMAACEELASRLGELASPVVEGSPSGGASTLEGTPVACLERVRALAAAGYDAVAIARETGLTTGEVTLILSLHGVK